MEAYISRKSDSGVQRLTEVVDLSGFVNCVIMLKAGSSLAAVRYHIFREPIPYQIGLKLQHDIVQNRLANRGKDKAGDDVILFLGMANATA